MKKLLYLFFLISLFGYSQTQITDANFLTAINTCLTTNPVDGLCSDSEYGAMPNWDVSSVTSMGGMFTGSAFNKDIGSWDVSKVTFLSQMFQETSFNQDISSWDVSNVVHMHRMFWDNFDFNKDISSWDVSNVTNFWRIFENASSFNQDISSWDISSATNVNYFFKNSGMSTDNYDKILKEWSQQSLQSDLSFWNDGMTYCNGESGRQTLISAFGWDIRNDVLDCSTAGVDDQNQLDISIYPNPTNDKLFIQGLSSSSRVSIYNVLGKLVLSQTISKEIDVKQLSKGIYMLKIVDEQKEIVRKFIKN